MGTPATAVGPGFVHMGASIVVSMGILMMVPVALLDSA
jgi:hypothetical protein